MMNDTSDLVNDGPRADWPVPRERDLVNTRLFYVIWTGGEARVTHDARDAREALRWQKGHGGRVFVMSKTADCATLLTTAPALVQQSVRQFLHALTDGQGVQDAERQSRVCLSAEDVMSPGADTVGPARPYPKP